MRALKKVICTDNQNLTQTLRVGQVYEVMVDVVQGRTARAPAASGYILREEGSANAMPFVFRRSRFDDVDSGGVEE